MEASLSRFSVCLGAVMLLGAIAPACAGGGETGHGGETTSGTTTTSGTGGTGTTSSTGGSTTGGHGPPASDLVNGGDVVRSPGYKMVFTLGQPTQNQTKTTSPSYRMQGGLIGATGN